MELLKKLCSIHATSGNESAMKQFVLSYVNREQSKWKKKPVVLHGDGFQDCVILLFGKPRAAVYAHMDSIGFTVRYGRELLKIGGPKCEEGYKLTGQDAKGKITCELLPIESEDGRVKLEYVHTRQIERGTTLVFKQNWKESKDYIQSCYLDNRLGVWNALKLCETLSDGAIVFTTYEEHGGGMAGYLAKYLFEKYGILQALISDISWITEGVHPGKGPVITIRDGSIPRKVYVDKIMALAKKSKVSFQPEVEGTGGSDGTAIQISDTPVDWSFVGSPIQHVHTPNEKVHKKDVAGALALYQYLMKNL
ncbi:MAG: aminopeptidase [Flavobacteriales bacterium]